MNGLAKATGLFGRPVSQAIGMEVAFVCPKCDKDRLYCNVQTGWWYCHRCQFKGNINRRDKAIRREKFEVKILQPPSLYQIEARAIRPQAPAWSYLRKKRKFTKEQILRFNVQFSPFHGKIKLPMVNEADEVVDEVEKYVDLRGGAIFPIYDNGYRGYQTRYINAREKSLRWMSAPGTPRSSLLFNADEALKHPVVYIAEGIPAACSQAFGSSGVATFGNGYSAPQVTRLLQSDVKHFYVAYDGDVRGRAYQLATELLEGGKDVSVVEFTGKEDPDSVDNLAERITAAEPLNEDQTMLLSRIHVASPFERLWRTKWRKRR